MNSIIAMLIWGGTMTGGPAIIQGFETVEACERARPVMLVAMTLVSSVNTLTLNHTKCVLLSAQ